jgi:dihydroneopterin aldolase
MKILLQNMEFFAYHGVYPDEQKNGNLFSVDLEFDADLEHAAKTDNLDDTLDYEQIYNLVQQEINITSNLLENIAGRICDAVKTSYPEISFLKVRVTKHNPPLSGKVQKVSVEKSVSR